jgi:arsenate reductase
MKMAATTRISKERKELLSRYATAAGFLYGVISADEFVEVFNYYEGSHTTRGEVITTLKRLSKSDDVEYSISGSIITSPDFIPEFEDYKDNVAHVRAAQKGKPRYLPDKAEFLRYADASYRESEKPYADLKAHILKHRLTDRSEGVDGIDGDLLDLWEMIQNGVKTTEIFDHFTDCGYRFNNTESVNSFAQAVMNVCNNTRLYENNGFTPQEIFEKYERPLLRPLPKEPFKVQVTPKVGRNDLCPCGSGLKYKKCCGKIHELEGVDAMKTFICYPKCATCRKARKWLDEKGIEYVVRDIKTDNPSYDELKAWLAKSALPIKRFFNTGGLQYKALGLKDKLLSMNEDECLKLLATGGMLVKRPLLVGDGAVLVGFKESEWEEKMDGKEQR